MRRARSAAVALSFAAAFVTTNARGDEPPVASSLVPVRFVARPLTMPVGVGRVDLAFGYQHGGPGTWSLALGGGYAVTSDFELDATVIPLNLSPQFQYTNPSVSGTYRFIRGETLEAGGFLGLTVHTQNTRVTGALTITPGLPILVHIADSARLDTGVFIPITFGGDTGTVLGVFAPIAVSFQVVNQIYVGAGTGLGVFDFSHFGDTIYAPLNGYAGYTLPFACSALVDFRGTLGFPDLYLSGVHGGIVTDNWQAIASASVYLPVGPAQCAK